MHVELLAQQVAWTLAKIAVWTIIGFAALGLIATLVVLT